MEIHGQEQLQRQELGSTGEAGESIVAAASPKKDEYVTVPIETGNGAKQAGDDRPTAAQVATWVRDAYVSRAELAYDFSITQVQRNDRTWTYQGSALYSGRKSLVTMTEAEGTRIGRQLRYACDIHGDQAVLTEQDGDICASYTIPAESLKEPANWDRRLDVNTQCIFGVVLKSWLGSDPAAHHVNKLHEFISQGQYIGDKSFSDPDGTTHACYAVMNGVEGNYEVYFVDKSSHLVRRWYVDRTSISRDSVYRYRTPGPLAPDTFRIDCPNADEAVPPAADASPMD